MPARIERQSVTAYFLLVLAGTGLAGITVAEAGYSFLTAPAPGGFMQAGAGPNGTGGDPWPGTDFASQFPNPASEFNEMDFAGPGPMSVSAAFASATTVNGCVGTVGLGFAKYAAHNNAPNNSAFAHAIGDAATELVDDTRIFAVPITFGTPFKLGIYARGRAGMRSNSGVPGNSTANVTFDGPGQGLFWGGVVGIVHGGATIAGATITSGSGINWSQPVGDAVAGDLNGDGIVDSADLGVLLASWGPCADCADCPADLNGDCIVDSADLGILLGNWG